LRKEEYIVSTLLDDLYEKIGHDFDVARVTDAQDEGYQGEFRITDQGGAIWAMRKIKSINARLVETKATATAEITRIQAWLQAEEEKANRERAFFEHLLQDYAEQLRAEDPKFKSLNLPHGKIAFRKQAPEFIRDNNILLAWIKANRPEFVRIKEEPDWASLKKEVAVAGEQAVDANGEIIEGVTVVTREDKFIVEVE
jgi:hypothetical protein